MAQTQQQRLSSHHLGVMSLDALPTMLLKNWSGMLTIGTCLFCGNVKVANVLPLGWVNLLLSTKAAPASWQLDAPSSSCFQSLPPPVLALQSPQRLSAGTSWKRADFSHFWSSWSQVRKEWFPRPWNQVPIIQPSSPFLPPSPLLISEPANPSPILTALWGAYPHTTEWTHRSVLSILMNVEPLLHCSSTAGIAFHSDAFQ